MMLKMLFRTAPSVVSFISRSNRRYLQIHQSDILQRIKCIDRANNVAVVTVDGEPITFQQLDNASSQLAEIIELKTMFKDSSVGGFTKTSESFLISMLAAWKLGRVFVPLSPTHSISELSYFVEDSSIGCVICSKADDISPEFREYLKAPLIESAKVISSSTSSEKSDKPVLNINNNDEALIVYTSGTTGRPKAVVHTHEGINHMVWSLTTAWKYADTDKILHFLPLYHVHGILNKLLCVLWAGGEVEFMESANPNLIWQKLASEAMKRKTSSSYKAATLFMGVPTVYARLLDTSSSLPKDALALALETLKEMRLHACGSAALPDPVMDRWRTLTGHILLERYGMTEIGMALSNPYSDGDRRKGFVGKPLPFVDCKLVDLESNIDVNVTNTPGEIRIKGPCVFKYYKNRPRETAETFDENGWFKTGDVAERSEDGFYKILGRNSSDIIKSSGYKISSLEIERELLGHPQIAEAAVVGKPDEVVGEKIVAILSLRPLPGGNSPNANLTLEFSTDKTAVAIEGNARLLKPFLQDKLAHYKQPKEVMLVDSIPRNHMGKVNKKSLLKDICYG